MPRRRASYEGFYGRVSDARRGESYAFIYGAAQGAGFDGSYLILLDGRRRRRAFAVVPLGVPQRPSDMHAGAFHGEVPDAELPCRWRFELREQRPFPRGSSMGWVRHLPGLETRWDVDAHWALARGELQVGDVRRRYEGVPAYVEWVRGRVFPERWLWMQASCFDRPKASFAASGGTVPLPGMRRGPSAYIVGWDDGERGYRFSTQQGDRIRAEARPGFWRLDCRGLRWRLQVEGRCERASLVPLEGPTPQGLRAVAHESLDGEIEVVLFRRTRGGWREVQRSVSVLAGLEVGGRWADGA